MKNEDVNTLYQHIGENNIVFFHGIKDIIKKNLEYLYLGKESKNYRDFGVPITILSLDRLSYFITNNYNKKIFISLTCFFTAAYILCDISKDFSYLPSFSFFLLLAYYSKNFSSIPAKREIGLSMNYVVSRLNPDRGMYSPNELGVPPSYFGSRRFTSWIYGQ